MSSPETQKKSRSAICQIGFSPLRRISSLPFVPSSEFLGRSQGGISRVIRGAVRASSGGSTVYLPLTLTWPPLPDAAFKFPSSLFFPFFLRFFSCFFLSLFLFFPLFYLSSIFPSVFPSSFLSIFLSSFCVLSLLAERLHTSLMAEGRRLRLGFSMEHCLRKRGPHCPR